MRILLINDIARYGNGGGNRVVVETLEGLHARGHTVGCIFHSGTAELSPGIWTRHVDDRQPQPTVRRAMLDAIAELQPDFIQSHSTQVLESYQDWAPRYPTAQFAHDESWFCAGGNRVDRSLTHCHRAHGIACLPLNYAIGCGGKSPVGNLKRWLRVGERIQVGHAQKIEFQVASNFMRQGFLENGFPPERIEVIPLYASAPTVASATEHGLIVAPARLFFHKGIAVLLEALHTVKDTPWRLVVPGNGPEKPHLEALAQRLGVADRLLLPGELHPDEVARWYARSQIVAFPVLRAEPFGLVGVEALAHGKPIVAFAGGAVDEWLWPGETGLKVDEKSPAALGRALRELLMDPQRCDAMGRAAQIRYKQFTLDAYLDRLLRHFEQIRERFYATRS